MQPYPVYIFDLYGTLADVHTDESPAALWEDAAAFAFAYGARCTGAALKERYHAYCADEIMLRKKALPDVPQNAIEPELLNVFSRLLNAFGGDGSDENAKALARFFRKRSTIFLKPMPHALETLDALHARGAKLYLLSNAQSCFTCDELTALDLARRFDGILLSSDAGMKKPYRGLFSLLLNAYRIDPASALMVGNDATADISGACSVGLNSAYYHTWSSPPRPKTLPATCSEISGLSELL